MVDTGTVGDEHDTRGARVVEDGVARIAVVEAHTEGREQGERGGSSRLGADRSGAAAIRERAGMLSKAIDVLVRAVDGAGNYRLQIHSDFQSHQQHQRPAHGYLARHEFHGFRSSASGLSRSSSMPSVAIADSTSHHGSMRSVAIADGTSHNRSMITGYGLGSAAGVVALHVVTSPAARLPGAGGSGTQTRTPVVLLQNVYVVKLVAFAPDKEP